MILSCIETKQTNKKILLWKHPSRKTFGEEKYTENSTPSKLNLVLHLIKFPSREFLENVDWNMKQTVIALLAALMVYLQ